MTATRRVRQGIRTIERLRVGKEADLDEVDPGCGHAFHRGNHQLRIHRGQVADGGADGPACADCPYTYAHRCMIECAKRAA
jgi:hypothetical protein